MSTIESAPIVRHCLMDVIYLASRDKLNVTHDSLNPAIDTLIPFSHPFIDRSINR